MVGSERLVMYEEEVVGGYYGNKANPDYEVAWLRVVMWTQLEESGR